MVEISAKLRAGKPVSLGDFEGLGVFEFLLPEEDMASLENLRDKVISYVQAQDEHPDPLEDQEDELGEEYVDDEEEGDGVEEGVFFIVIHARSSTSRVEGSRPVFKNDGVGRIGAFNICG